MVSHSLPIPDVTVSTACCSSLDNVITFIFKKTRRNGETMVVEKLRDIVKMQNNVFQQVHVLDTRRNFTV